MAVPNTPQAPESTPKRLVDWDAIEPHYRAGTRALKDIGKQFGVSDAAIIKHARKEEWTRNLKAKIQAKADALVSAKQVSVEVSAAKTRTKKAAEKQVVDVEAHVQARIRLGHRSDIGRARTLGMHLFAEVEQQTLNPELFDKIAHALAGIPKGVPLSALPEDEQKKVRALLGDSLTKALALNTRTATYKALVDSLTRLVGLEREAYGINPDAGDLTDPLAQLLHGFKARTIQPVADDPDLRPAP